MHTFKTEGGVTGAVKYVFHHNGDYSGDVEINIFWDDGVPDHRSMTGYLRIPFEALAEFFGDAVVQNRIGQLEQQRWREVFDWDHKS